MRIYFNKISLLLSDTGKRSLIFMFFFSIIVSLIETIGIAIIMPFISVASDFEKIHTNKYIEIIYNFFNFTSEINFVIGFGVGLIFFYIIRSALNLTYFYFLSKFSKGIYYTLSVKLLKNFLQRSYRDYIEENSSNLSKTIINEALNFTMVLSSILFILSELFVVIFIYSFMIFMDWKITFFLTCFLLLNAFILIKTVTKKIKKEGINRESFQKNFYETLNSTFGNFKIIKLKVNIESVLDKFSITSKGFSKSNIINETLSHLPRLYLEAISFILLIFIVIYLLYTNQSNISQFMALISVFILGLYRLMPSVNRILSGYNQIVFYSRSTDILSESLLFETEKLNKNKIDFKKSIKLDDLKFGYVKNNYIINNVNLTIKKGSKIAFIGESGSGKSTLVDIIMGLYKPVEGSVLIDGIKLTNDNMILWRKKIGYIPQDIYLFDGNIAQNVAFDDSFDEKKVIEVLKKTKLFDFLNKYHQGILTEVGEKGVKLSGGQKQRVAIARALYDDPEILVLDEATSALDNETEAKIMDEIYDVSENKTLIIIAHRLTTIEKCDKIYNLENGEIK